MSRAAGLWMAGLVALSSGCGLGVHGQPPPRPWREPVSAAADRARCQKLADYAWHIFRKAHPGEEFTTEYADGFKEGFVEGLDTGESDRLAPASASHSPERSAGFRQGAEAATRDGQPRRLPPPSPKVIEPKPTMLPERVSLPRESVEPPSGQGLPCAPVVLLKGLPLELGTVKAAPVPSRAERVEEILILPEFHINGKRPASIFPVPAEEEKPTEAPDLFARLPELTPAVAPPQPLTTVSAELEDDTAGAFAVESPALMSLPAAPSVPSALHPRSVVPAGSYAPLPLEAAEPGTPARQAPPPAPPPAAAPREPDLPVTAPLVVTAPPEVRLGPAVAPRSRAARSREKVSASPERK